MKPVQERCEHCGKWVSINYAALYTLHNEANNHPHEEDVAICLKCSQTYKPDYWSAWLDRRFAKDGSK